MKLVYSDFRKGEAKVSVDNVDDLWYLSTIIDKGDSIKGSTVRKIKFGDETKQKVERKKVFLTIDAEKVEFDPKSNTLRVLGIITDGPELVARGDHHSFDIEDGTTITIIKERWLDFQIKKLKEAAEQKLSKILVVVHDREEAYLALLKKFGYNVLATLKGDVVKKGSDEKKSRNFYDEIINAIKEYDKKHNFENIIIASPAFWKEDLMKNLKDDDLKKKIVLATCSSCDEKAIDEVLKRPEVNVVLKKDRITKEIRLIDELLTEISRDNQAVYGLNEVENAVNMGAVKTLLVTDRMISESRESDDYKNIEQIMKNAEQNKGEVHIISSKHDGGKKLDGLGGIGAVLRYKIR